MEDKTMDGEVDTAAPIALPPERPPADPSGPLRPGGNRGAGGHAGVLLTGEPLAAVTPDGASDMWVTQLEAPEPLVFDMELCIGCGGCARRCRARAISMVADRPCLDSELCTRCGLCAQRCGRGAISFAPGFSIMKEGG